MTEISNYYITVHYSLAELKWCVDKNVLFLFFIVFCEKKDKKICYRAQSKSYVWNGFIVLLHINDWQNIGYTLHSEEADIQINCFIGNFCLFLFTTGI